MELQTNRIRGEIVARGFSQKQVAEKLGITPHALRYRLRTGRFNSDQLYMMAKLLKLEDPWHIFFDE